MQVLTHVLGGGVERTDFDMAMSGNYGSPHIADEQPLYLPPIDDHVTSATEDESSSERVTRNSTRKSSVIKIEEIPGRPTRKRKAGEVVAKVSSAAATSTKQQWLEQLEKSVARSRVGM